MGKQQLRRLLPCLLVFFSLLFVSLTCYLAPKIPLLLCVGASYSAFPLQCGYRHYVDFAEDVLLNKKVQVASAQAMISKSEKSETAVYEQTATAGARITNDDAAPADILPSDIQNNTAYKIDSYALMEGFESPKRNTQEPQILILHTHATEAFADSDNRSTDNTKNMIAVGNALYEALTQKGFQVLHDTTHHDYPNYNGSYVNSLATAERYLKDYPSIEIILDLHRDGITNEDGTKVKLVSRYEGKPVARLMLVVGTDAGGLYHPHWKENLRFAMALQQAVSHILPTIMRPINLRTERFNQHTTKHSVIIECGTNGNELEEAKASMQILSQALDRLIR